MGNGAHEHCSLHWLRPPATQANKLYPNISSTTLVWAPCGQMQSKHPILGFTLGSRTKVFRVLYFWVKLQTTNERYTIKYQQTCRSIHSRTLAALLQITVEPSSATQHLTLQGKEHLRQLEYPAKNHLLFKSLAKESFKWFFFRNTVRVLTIGDIRAQMVNALLGHARKQPSH